MLYSIQTAGYSLNNRKTEHGVLVQREIWIEADKISECFVRYVLVGVSLNFLEPVIILIIPRTFDFHSKMYTRAYKLDPGSYGVLRKFQKLHSAGKLSPARTGQQVRTKNVWGCVPPSVFKGLRLLKREGYLQLRELGLISVSEEAPI